MKKVIFVLVILFTIASMAAGSEKVLKIAVSKNPMFLDSVANSDNVSARVMKNIHETFIEVAKDGTIIPRLAESWNQIDSKTVEFTLRKRCCLPRWISA